MITIELDTLVTILVAVISIIASSVVTWFFSKRHYTKDTFAVNERDIELQKVKNESRETFLTFLLMVILILGVLSFFVMLAVLSKI